MKITVFGLTVSSSWGNGHATLYRAILKGLHAQGAKVTFFEKDVPYYARHRDLHQSGYCDLRLYSTWDSVRQSALKEAAASDIVVNASYVPEGSRINDELLNLSGPIHVFYDLDTPITLKRMREEGIDYLREEQISCFDLYLSFTGGPILRELQNRYGAKMARPLYGCVDPDSYYRRSVRNDWLCDLSYMGTYAPDRQAKLEQFFLQPARCAAEKNFLLAGSMYPRDLNLACNVKHLDHVAPTEHPHLYSSSRATLNITRAEMAAWGYCPSGRFFEATACGTPVLTDEWDGLGLFFEPEEELLVVRRSEDVMEAIRCPGTQLEHLAKRARERTLNEHTGHKRAQQLLQYCHAAVAGTASLEIAS